MFFYNLDDFAVLNMTLKYVMFLKKFPCFILNRHVYCKKCHIESNYVWFKVYVAGSFGLLGQGHCGSGSLLSVSLLSVSLLSVSLQ